MEFLTRPDAYNVFDYLLPGDLLALSCTSKAMRIVVNDYCSIKVQNVVRPEACLLVKRWFKTCVECKRQCDTVKKFDFVATRVMNTKLPICSQYCLDEYKYTKTIAKSAAKDTYFLTDKDIECLRYKMCNRSKMYLDYEVRELFRRKYKVSSDKEINEMLKLRRALREKNIVAAKYRRMNQQSDRQNLLFVTFVASYNLNNNIDGKYIRESFNLALNCNDVVKFYIYGLRDRPVIAKVIRQLKFIHFMSNHLIGNSNFFQVGLNAGYYKHLSEDEIDIHIDAKLNLTPIDCKNKCCCGERDYIMEEFLNYIKSRRM